MSLAETHTTITPDQESAVVGLPCADAAPQRFPPNILTSRVMTEQDFRAIGQPPPALPKGAPAANEPARAWLPCNEQLAVQLGHAQAALRLLDDQRALVVSVQVHADLVVIDLARAPQARTVQWQHAEQRGECTVVTADLDGADHSVLLRWPLSSGAAEIALRKAA